MLDMLDLARFYCPKCNKPFTNERSVYKIKDLVWISSHECNACNLKCNIQIENDDFEDAVMDVLVFKKPNDRTFKGTVIWPNGDITEETVRMEVIV